jgi:hypothetical protein
MKACPVCAETIQDAAAGATAAGSAAETCVPLHDEETPPRMAARMSASRLCCRR